MIKYEFSTVYFGNIFVIYQIINFAIDSIFLFFDANIHLRKILNFCKI